MVSTLHDHLQDWADDDRGRTEIAAALDAIAGAAAQLAEVIGLGPLAGALAAVVGDAGGGDAQKELDVRANELFLQALRAAPVAVFGSEENAEPIDLQPGAALAVAIDPLDGSSNIDTNVPIGTIFSILPMPSSGDAASAFGQPGDRQLGAGFVIYGPQTALVLSVRTGTQMFTLDRRTGTFMLTESAMQIPGGKPEYAINASNYRHWDEPIRSYIDDCIAGAEGPGGSDFNMRWIASLVAEACRVLRRGGIFLYPARQSARLRARPPAAWSTRRIRSP